MDIATRVCDRLIDRPYAIYDQGDMYTVIWAPDLRTAVGKTGDEAADYTVWAEFGVVSFVGRKRRA